MTLPATEANAGLSTAEMVRYSRHVVLRQVGLDGQQRLKRASVLIVGAGGLGCPAALYLASAGIGRIGIADHDTVDTSNLQRQVLYRDADEGHPKAVVAARVLREVNPHITVEAHETRIDERNAQALVARYDMVLDGCDSVETRYALNAACVAAGKPYIYGSVHQFEGQVSVFGLPGGPCYACLFPKAAAEACTCTQGGVLGVVPGIIGTHQAAEALKLALGLQDVLSGRLLICDTLGLRFDTLTVPRDPQCSCCSRRNGVGKHRETSLGETPRPTALLPEELGELLARDASTTLLDVREPAEMIIDPLPGALHIPMNEIARRCDEVPRDQPVVVYCRRGVRSAGVAMFLAQAGIADVRHLAGGLHAWVHHIHEAMERSA